MIEEKKGELRHKPSYMKLSRKKEKERFQFFQVNRSQEETRGDGKVRGISLLNFKTEGNQGNQRQQGNNSLLRKYEECRSKEKEQILNKRTTPYQARKMMDKAQTSKTLTKILNKNRMESNLEHSQDKFLVVKQIPVYQQQSQQKNSENIRQTDTTLKGQRQSFLLNKQGLQSSKFLLNSWLFPCSNEKLMVKNARELLKNKKMTLKEIWRVKNRIDSVRIIPRKQIDGKEVKNSKQKIEEVVARINSNKSKLFFLNKGQMMQKQESIHSRPSKKKKNLIKPSDNTSIGLKIKQCSVDQSTLIQIRNNSICCSSSQSKIGALRQSQSRKTQSRQSARYRPSISCKKIKTEQYKEKEVCGWQIINDFSQREQLF